MQVHKPIILQLPSLLIDKLDFDLDRCPPKLNYNKSYFYYLLDYISIQQTKQKDNEYYYLDKAYLKKVTASNVHRYIKYLASINLFISDNKFKIGEKPFYYKLNEDYLKGSYRKIEIKPNDKLFKKLYRNNINKKAHISRLPSHLRLMNKEFMNIEIDYHNALKWIENNTQDEAKKFSYISAINNLKDKRFRYFNRNKTNNRLDTNLTNLKSDLKQFIIGDYTSIDLSNSQPFLLGALLNNIINNSTTYCCYLHSANIAKAFGIKRFKRISKLNQNQEKCNMVNLSMYFSSVCTGALYNDFISQYEGSLTRKEVKNIMFKVMFSANVKGAYKVAPYADEKKVFKSVYPFVYDCIHSLKHNDKDNNLLPIYLQKLESYLFIDCIAKRLCDENIIPLTIHDSVIVKTKDKERALEIIKEVFLSELGVIPSFNIEGLKPKGVNQLTFNLAS